MSVAIKKEPNWEWPDLLDLNIEITQVKNYKILELDKETLIAIETIEGYKIAFKLPKFDLGEFSNNKTSKKEELAHIGIESNKRLLDDTSLYN